MKTILLPLLICILLVSAGCGSGSTNSSISSRIITLNMAELAKHNSASNCWLLISGSLYNVTSFLPEHPGGEEQIIPFCGKDATAAFATKDGRGSHSDEAQAQLTSLVLGKLGTTITLQ